MSSRANLLLMFMMVMLDSFTARRRRRQGYDELPGYGEPGLCGVVVVRPWVLVCSKTMAVVALPLLRLA